MSTLLASPAKKSPQRPVRPIGGSFEDFGELDREEVYYEENGQEKSIYEYSTFIQSAPSIEIQAPPQETVAETFAAQGSIEILTKITESEEIRPTTGGTINFQERREIIVEEKTPETIRENQELPKPRQETVNKPITEKLGKVASLTSNFLEFTGKVSPGLFKDIFSAIIGLFKEYILPPAKKAEKQTIPQEQETEKKRVEEKRHTEQHYQALAEDQKHVEKADQNQMLKIALGMIERPDVIATDAVDLGLNTSIDTKNIKSTYHISLLRTKQLEKKSAAIKNQKQQSIISASKKSGPNLDLNKVGEGGSILSSTGGAGAG